MKILFLCNDDPLHTGYGGGQRNKAMLDALQRLGDVHTLWLAMNTGDRQQVVSVRDKLECLETRSCDGVLARVRGLNFVRREVARRVRDHDVVIARNIAVGAVVPLSAHERLIFDCDDFKRSVVHATPKQAAFLAARHRAIRWLARRAAHCWLANEADAASLAAPAGRASVLPNIVAPFEPVARRTVEGGRLLMVGSYGYPPNHDGLTWFAKEVLPKLVERHPALELHAVGAFDDASLAGLSDHLIMRGFVDSLPEEYAQADAVICPIRSGSGTQIKLLEGLLSTRPVVSSSFSFNPLRDKLQAGEHLLVAGAVGDWVGHIDRVLKDPSEFIQMSARAREQVLTCFGPSVFQDEVRRSVIRAIGSRSDDG